MTVSDVPVQTPVSRIKRTPGTGGVIDLWKNSDGAPSKLATGKWAEGTSKKVQGVGNRWRGWYVGDDGKQYTKRFRTEAEAEAWSNAHKGKVVTHQWVDPGVGTQTFREVANQYLASKAHLKPKSVVGYESVFKTLAEPRWGDVPMKDIKYQELQSWLAGLSVNGSQRGTGLSPSRIRQTHQLMHAVYKYGLKAGLVTRNVVADVDRRTDLPKDRAKEMVFLTLDQLLGLADCIESEYRTLTLVLGFCGIRPSEAFALKRGNVKNGKLRIRESATYVTGQGMVTTGTKTGQNRDVAVPGPVWKELIKGLPDDNDALVFPGLRGETMTLDQYRWRFDKAVTAMQAWAKAQRAEELAAGKLDEHGQPQTPEFPTCSPYALRHSAASLYIKTGANIKVVQRQLGHETASMTLDRYGHLYNEDLEAAAKVLGEAMIEAKLG